MTALIIGGSGSGKSEYAEKCICARHGENGTAPLIYIAAMQPFGEEARKRIERHRRLRAGKGFVTVERYTELSGLIVPKGAYVLLECLGNLTANEMFAAGQADMGCIERIERGIDTLAEQCEELFIVTNDVFCDGEEYGAETDMYMRALAEINIYAAGIADTVCEVVCSMPAVIKGDIKCSDH